MKKVKLYAAIVTMVGLISGSAFIAPSITVSAAACNGTAVQCATQGANATGQSGNGSAAHLDTAFKLIVNTILYILGAVAVIMIVIGGIRYTTSGGDSGQVSSAKNTILYAVVGLIVAILAYAIVNFVLTSFK